MQVISSYGSKSQMFLKKKRVRKTQSPIKFKIFDLVKEHLQMCYGKLYLSFKQARISIALINTIKQNNVFNLTVNMNTLGKNIF